MTSRLRPPRVFLLSPARAGGVRAGLLLRPGAAFPLAQAVQAGAGATLGEVFRFTSGLYFRGKLAYAAAFARPPPGLPGALVIAPGLGLVDPALPVTADLLRALGAVPVDPRDPRFAAPLARDAAALADRLGPDGEAVLLGSVASGKYAAVLLPALGRRLLFPPSFVGRGDMSRGGLLLRAARAGEELPLAQVDGAEVHGARPPRLPRLPRRGPREAGGPAAGPRRAAGRKRKAPRP